MLSLGEQQAFTSKVLKVGRWKMLILLLPGSKLRMFYSK